VAQLFAEVREPRFQVLLRLIYGCGLRVGAALGLEIGDLQPEGPYVLVRRGKGGRRRRVPLPAAAAEEVRTWRLGHRNPRWLFPASGPGWVDGARRARCWPGWRRRAGSRIWPGGNRRGPGGGARRRP
jgi:integrase